MFIKAIWFLQCINNLNSFHEIQYKYTWWTHLLQASATETSKKINLRQAERKHYVDFASKRAIQLTALLFKYVQQMFIQYIKYVKYYSRTLLY